MRRQALPSHRPFINFIMRRNWLSPFLFLFLSSLSLLAAYALFSQHQTAARGLRLGAPLNRPSIYGLNIDLLNAPHPAEALDAIRRAGFVWVRQNFEWNNFDWPAADSLIRAAESRGLHLAAALGGGARPDPVEFAAFAGQFAARYSDQIDVYQIWDEPNLESGWGGPPSAAEYARVLQGAYAAIHRADPTAAVLLAGLAPTTETGPENISDVLYLHQLYALGAGGYFDAAAGKPYGFNFSPDDRTTDPSVLNFSRLILLREEMIAHGDGEKFLWASHFGWNNRPSIWGHVTPAQQKEYTAAAYARALNEWPWAGVMFLETNHPDLPPDDPHWGFVLNDLSGVVPQSQNIFPPGRYDALSLIAYANFVGDWKFSELGADIPQAGPALISFDFAGTDLAITVRRANYHAYLFVTIDGQPANALPRDSDGEAYLVLTSPDLEARTDTIPLAAGLAPGAHTAVIRAERGWDQWAIVNLTVGPNAAEPDVRLPTALLILLALFGAGAFALSISRIHHTWLHKTFLSPAGDAAQSLAAVVIAALLWASAWLTWGNDAANAFRRYGDAAPLLLTALTAAVFYYSPFLLLTLICLAALFVLFYLRPNLAPPLIAFFAPFYLLPRPLWDRAFSMVEICTLTAFAAAALRLIPLALNRGAPPDARRPRELFAGPVAALDLSVAAFVLISAASIAVAEIRGVAIREFRVIVLEPAMFYALLRLLPLERKDLWRVADFFIAGAAAVALIGLGNYATGSNLITAEGGVARIRSVFGSPNNLGLFLERALPVAAAVALVGRSPARRAVYALASLPIGAAILLSFSKGALLLGVPAALTVVVMFWSRRRAFIALAVLAVAGLIALVPLSRSPRFADLLDFTSGTSFFRVQVWRSALAMAADHPWLGVGLDNFLYQYRGRYILPEAWQEPNLPHAHNVLLDFLTRLGALGLAALMAALVSFFRLGSQNLRQNADPDLRALAVGLTASMVGALAHGMVDTAYWFVDLAFVFMMTLGLMAAAGRHAEPTPDRQRSPSGRVDESTW